MPHETDDYARRPARYAYAGGVAEMAAGLLLLAAGLALSFGRTGAIWFLAVVPPLSAAVYFGIGYVRERVVYPRTGYVRRRPSDRTVCSLSTAGRAASKKYRNSVKAMLSP